MKGYKIGINKDLLDFVLIELDFPEDYPGGIIFNYDLDKPKIPVSILIEPTWYYRDIYRGQQQYRANVARVLNIQKIKVDVPEYVDSAVSLYDQSFEYHPGEIIYPKSFDMYRDHLCTTGIHFYETVEDAIQYASDPWAYDRLIYAKRMAILQPRMKGIDF